MREKICAGRVMREGIFCAGKRDAGLFKNFHSFCGMLNNWWQRVWSKKYITYL